MRAEQAIRTVDAWMRGRGLEVAAQKTKAALLIGRRQTRGQRVIHALGVPIELESHIRYLGMWLDSGESWVRHVEEACRKADATARSIRSVMPRIGGAGDWARRLLASVHQSVVLYGAPIWADATRLGRVKAQLNRSQRPVLIAVARANRTVSTEALQVVAGVVPMDLQAILRKRNHRATAEEKIRNTEDILEAWQRRWEGGNDGAWTRRLIPSVRAWKDRSHGDLRYCTVQFLTGHGHFGTYLQRIGKQASSRCLVCNELETPEHVLFQCEEYQAERLEAERKVGEVLGAENLVNIMLSGAEGWTAVDDLCRAILIRKDPVVRRRLSPQPE